MGALVALIVLAQAAHPPLPSAKPSPPRQLQGLLAVHLGVLRFAPLAPAQLTAERSACTKCATAGARTRARPSACVRRHLATSRRLEARDRSPRAGARGGAAGRRVGWGSQMVVRGMWAYGRAGRPLLVNAGTPAPRLGRVAEWPIHRTTDPVLERAPSKRNGGSNWRGASWRDLTPLCKWLACLTRSSVSSTPEFGHRIDARSLKWLAQDRFCLRKRLRPLFLLCS